jgi:hypothetical protein
LPNAAQLALAKHLYAMKKLVFFSLLFACSLVTLAQDTTQQVTPRQKKQRKVAG